MTYLGRLLAVLRDPRPTQRHIWRISIYVFGKQVRQVGAHRARNRDGRGFSGGAASYLTQADGVAHASVWIVLDYLHR